MNSHRLEYEKRVNRVIDHVRAHLAEDLSLERLAHHAAFSPFHFHRIFRAITNETLFAFIQRLRLERAAVALIHHPDESVLAVALDHGFSSAAWLGHVFTAHAPYTAAYKPSSEAREGDSVFFDPSGMLDSPRRSP